MARLVRWDPYRELVNLRTEMDRLFGSFNGLGGETAMTGQWAPALDVYETEDRFVVHADLPGLTSEDIDLTLDQNLLTIRGERRFKEEVREENYHRVERRYGTFQRSLTLPTQVDADGIQASFTDGVLTVMVPKAEQAKPRKIKVGEGARQLEA